MPGDVAFRMSRAGRVAVLVLACSAAAACGNAPSTTALVDANVAIARRAIEEVWGKKNYAALTDIYAADYVSTNNGVQDTLTGPGQAEAFGRAVLAVYPDVTVTIDEVFATIDRAAMRWTFKATHAPTGKPVVVSGSWVGHIENGKITRGWNNYDNLAAALSTGATLTPAPPKK